MTEDSKGCLLCEKKVDCNFFCAIICSVLHKKRGGSKMDDFGLTRTLKNIDDKMEKVFNQDLSKCQLTKTQGFVLLLIENANGEISQKEIQCQLKCSHPTVVGIIKRLQQNGFVETRVDKRDRRNRLIRITQKALDTKEMIKQIIDHQNQMMIQYLTPQQIETLLFLLDRLNQGLDETLEKAKGEKDD